MDPLKAILACFPCAGNPRGDRRPSADRFLKDNAFSVSEKSLRYSDDPNSQEKAIREIFALLQAATKPSLALKVAIDDKIDEALVAAGDDIEETSWFSLESIARGVLEALAKTLETGKEKLGPAMQEMYDRVREDAEKVAELAEEHPYWTVLVLSLIALAMLYFMAPVLVRALGFEAEGVLKGSFAAEWQSTYGGFVSARSLFAYMQRWGATW